MIDREMTDWFDPDVAPVRVGWYDASVERRSGVRRYWDGYGWSMPVYFGDSDARATHWQHVRSYLASGIYWRGLTKPAEGGR